MKSNNVSFDNKILCDIFDNKILCDILSRLPAKSLLRFKCVSQGWRLMIEENYLINLHLTQLEKEEKQEENCCTAFLISPVYLQTPPGCDERKMTFLCAEDKLSSSSVACQRRFCHDISVPEFGTMLKPIYGLACFTNIHSGSVLIYNPCTGEKTPWIQTTTGKLLEDGYHKSGNKNISGYVCRFGFGFDPATKKHKLVCIYNVHYGKVEGKVEDNLVEVLTVGSNTWRKTDDVPPFRVTADERAVYVNNYIYWNCAQLEQCARILGFHVTSEKFNRVIEIPYFILDRRLIRRSVTLVQVDGRLALLDTEEDHSSINLCIYNDNDKKHGDCGGSWTKETIPMPHLMDVKSKPYLAFEAISGTDLIVLKPFCNPVDLDCLYYYNRSTKVYCEKQVNITRSSPDDVFSDLGYDITIFRGSLLPVQTSEQ